MNEFRQFHELVRNAPLINKIDFIRDHIMDKNVLDLGCIGHTLDDSLRFPDRWLHNIIRTNACSAVGVDINERDVMELRKRGYNTVCADVLTLRLDRKFDVVVCGDLIEHVNTLDNSLIKQSLLG